MNLTNGPLTTSKRIQWIDALRGFSMILVVFHHQMEAIFSVGNDQAIATIFATFRMPLFFFVSGFFAFRVAEKWTASMIKRVVALKLKAQIFGMLVFYSLFLYISGKPLNTIVTEGICNYWFTIALFQMFMIYLIVAVTAKLLLSDKLVVIGLIALTLAITGVPLLLGSTTAMYQYRICRILAWPGVCMYFQFFVLGIFTRKYFPVVEQIIRRDWVRATAITVYVALLLLVFNSSFEKWNNMAYTIVYSEMVKYVGLLVVFIFFYSAASYFDGDSRVSRWMKFVGTRTLDIYYLHWFFLPSLPWLASYLADSNGNEVTMQLLVGITLSVVVVALCLFVSSIIRSSSTLATWLFGVKPVKAPANTGAVAGTTMKSN